MTIEGPKAARGMEIRSAAELGESIFNPDGARAAPKPRPNPPPDEVRENLRVFTDGERVVSIVAMTYREIILLGTRHVACCFGGVCTDPDYRGRQLASRLLVDAKQKALRDGADTVIISGGIGIYTRQGYVPVGDYSFCTVSRDRLPVGRGEGEPDYVLRPPTPEDMPALFRMHLTEPVRFVRTPEELLRCVSSTRVFSHQGETLVVCPRGGGQPVAYLTCFFSGQAWHRKDANAIQVVELAGSRWAILRVLPALLERRGLESLELRYGGWDEEIVAMVRAYGWPSQPSGFRGTVGIIDPARFWHACADLFRERLGAERFGRLRFAADGAVTIGYGPEQIMLEDMTAFTRLVMEHPARRHELQLGLAPDSELSRALGALFPLPIVNYGLTYL
jgi:GNAT superfamily N-acetyltransferase